MGTVYDVGNTMNNSSIVDTIPMNSYKLFCKFAELLLYLYKHNVSMERVVFNHQVIDSTTGEVIEQRIIKKQVSSLEQFHRMYTEDVGALLKCTKGEVDLILCCIKLGFIGFNTNELVLNSSRKRQICECSGLKIRSVYSFMTSLRAKNIIVSNGNRLYLNPKLFFFGSDLERDKMFKLEICYTIAQEQ